MKTMMKKTAAYLLALLLVIQMVPAFAETTYSGTYIQKDVTYRDAIEITPGLDVDILKVGMENQLTVQNNYKNVSWESDHPEIATVDETGLVKAVSEGKATITVISEGQYKDTISFKIISETKAEEPTTEPEAQHEEKSTEPDAQPVESRSSQDEEKVQEEKIIIFIKGNKTKIEYDGTVQKNTYTITTSNDELFDESRLTMTADHLAEEKNCGVWQDTMTEADFTYDGNAEIVVSNGWLQIKPVTVRIKANDAVQKGSERPEFTATVTGLLEGDDPETIQYTLDVYMAGDVNYITPVCESIQGNYRVVAEPGVLTIENDIYRAVKLTSDWPAGEPAYAGTLITMTAELIGFEDVDYTLQWQHSVDNKEWINEPDAKGTTYTFELNETTVQYTWRVVANY
jgi:hypothetical protein